MTRHSVNSARHWTITVSANETGGDKGNSPRTAMAKRLDRQEVKMNLSSRQWQCRETFLTETILERQSIKWFYHREEISFWFSFLFVFFIGNRVFFFLQSVLSLSLSGLIKLVESRLAKKLHIKPKIFLGSNNEFSLCGQSSLITFTVEHVCWFWPCQK